MARRLFGLSPKGAVTLGFGAVTGAHGSGFHKRSGIATRARGEIGTEEDFRCQGSYGGDAHRGCAPALIDGVKFDVARTM